MKIVQHYDHLAEIWAEGKHPGPTGRFAHVLEGEVRDYGGNVLFRGSAAACTQKAKRYRIPTQLVPTKWVDVGTDATSSGLNWLMVDEDE